MVNVQNYNYGQTKNQKFVAKHAQYTIFENIRFKFFEFDTPPIIRNGFHVDRFRPISMDFFLQFFMTTTRAIPLLKKKPPNMKSKRSRKRKGGREGGGRGYQYLVK